MKIYTSSSFLSQKSKSKGITGEKICNHKILHYESSNSSKKCHNNYLGPQSPSQDFNTISNGPTNKNQQENLSNTRGYRILLHVFAENLNKFYLKNQKKVLGELEEIYRIPISKQEQLLTGQQLRAIFQKNIQKFSRDMLSRNQNIIKNYVQYQKQYASKKIKLTLLTIQNQNLEPPEPQKPQNPKRKRPSSSISHYSRYKSIRNPQSASISYEKQAKTFTIQNQQVFVAENFRRKNQNSNAYTKNRMSVRERKCLCQNSAYLNFNLINQELFENKDLNIEGKGRKEGLRNQETRRKGRKQKNTCYNNWKYVKDSVQKCTQSIEQSREKISQKFITINKKTSFSIIQTISQGYKPKSKCWGNTRNLQYNTLHESSQNTVKISRESRRGLLIK